MLSGVLPQPFHPMSPLAPEPAAASDSATTAVDATRTSHDAPARLISRESYSFATLIGRAGSRGRFDPYGCVEPAVHLVHEVRGGVHVHVEREQRSLGDQELVPAGGLRVAERDAPRRRSVLEDARVRPRE